MKLSSRYNQVNIFTSLVILIITGIIYYLLIHYILTDKLDRDLAVEENEIKQYATAYNKLPLPATYLDQQVIFTPVNEDNTRRFFENTKYFNPKEKEFEPGRSLITTVLVAGQNYEVKITKSRVESEDLFRMIFLITLGVILILLLALFSINKLVFNRLWKPFYIALNRMKTFEISSRENIETEATHIDEFNELNISMNAMISKVQRDYRELKSFTDNASHEMMTPLAVINSKLDSLLQAGSFNPQQGLLLEDIYKATGRLSRLHQSLLLLAKIENNLISDLQYVDFQQILQEKIRQFNELFEHNGLYLEVDIKPCTVNMSGYLADILINNLLSNTVRHNIPQGRIYISLKENSLVVSNTGKSLKNDRLFDRFSKSADSEGMGLGLAISKQICNLYLFQIQYQQQDKLHTFIVNF